MSVSTTFIVKKIQIWTEPKSGKDEPKPVNRGSPSNQDEIREWNCSKTVLNAFSQLSINLSWYLYAITLIVVL